MRMSEVVMKQSEIDGYIEVGKAVRAGGGADELLDKLVASGALSTTRNKQYRMTWADGFAMLFFFVVVIFIGYLLR